MLLAGLLCLSHPTWAADLAGRVVGLADGDTITILTAERRQVRVRLGEIDTPESGQPYGARAREALSELVFGKDVRVMVQDTDRYSVPIRRVPPSLTWASADLTGVRKSVGKSRSGEEWRSSAG